MTSKEDWSQNSGQPPMTPEQIILWLEGIRTMMFEVWEQNPQLRKEWEDRNQNRPIS
jgi:hypothetical protein